MKCDGNLNKRKIESFSNSDGVDYFYTYYSSLPLKHRIKIMAMLQELQEINLLVAQRQLWVRRLESGLYELRCHIDEINAYGILFFVTKNKFILTNAYFKKSSAANVKQKKIAQKIRKEWEQAMVIDNLLQEESKKAEYKKAYDKEKAKLDSATSLYFAREEAGLTQVELAELSGTTQSTIARIERGDNVSFEKLAQLAQAMNKKLAVSFD